MHRILKKITLIMLILSIASLNVPNWVFAQVKTQPMSDDRVTTHSPEVLTTPEKNIPRKKPEWKINKWVWIGLGVVAAGAIAAAAAGGSSDDGGSSGPAENNDTGNITISW